jgi:hypothetical protein
MAKATLFTPCLLVFLLVVGLLEPTQDFRCSLEHGSKLGFVDFADVLPEMVHHFLQARCIFCV